jgi:hypothetical protein
MARGTSDLGRFLQPPTARERAVLASLTHPAKDIGLPARIGPAEFSMLGGMVAVRCPADLAPLVQKAGGIWEPGSRRWLVERRRMGPLIRNLRRTTDPLFRRAGISLDQPEGGAHG